MNKSAKQTDCKLKGCFHSFISSTLWGIFLFFFFHISIYQKQDTSWAIWQEFVTLAFSQPQQEDWQFKSSLGKMSNFVRFCLISQWKDEWVEMSSERKPWVQCPVRPGNGPGKGGKQEGKKGRQGWRREKGTHNSQPLTANETGENCLHSGFYDFHVTLNC